MCFEILCNNCTAGLAHLPPLLLPLDAQEHFDLTHGSFMPFDKHFLVYTTL